MRVSRPYHPEEKEKEKEKGGNRLSVTGMKGFEKLKNYGGDPLHWKDWRFKTTTWLENINRSFKTLIPKFDVCEVEPQEPEAGQRMKVGMSELTMEEEWCAEELYQLLVQKCDGSSLAIVRNQNTLGKARGLIAWYRTLWDAEGQVETKKTEITEKVFNAGRKAVAAKDVLAAIACWEEEVREYKLLTGLDVDNLVKMLNLKRILPEEIEAMLQTVEITDYTLAREYVIKQARALSKKKGNKPLQLDLNEDEEEPPKKKTHFEEESPQEPESY